MQQPRRDAISEIGGKNAGGSGGTLKIINIMLDFRIIFSEFVSIIMHRTIKKSGTYWSLTVSAYAGVQPCDRTDVPVGSARWRR